MFCPNCGEKLDSPNQRFCSSCGSELQFTPIPESPQIPIEEVQIRAPPPTQTVPIYQPKTIKEPGSYSKKTFAFSFLSLVLAVIGFSLEFLSFLKFITPSYAFPRLPGGPMLLIAALILHFVGVIFAVVSRVNSKRAREHEIQNSLERTGRVFGILGIIANVIPLVVINLVLVFYVIPYSVYPVPPPP